MKQRPEVRDLLYWLSISGNSTAKLASLLGYKSSSTISKWIKNNKIPHREIERVKEVTKGK